MPYSATILVAFGIVTVLSGSQRDADDLEDYRGLFWQRPVIATVFTVALLSLAGIPATMGFVSKFYVLAAGAAGAAWSLILILVISSVAGLFYYLRIVVALYSDPPEHAFIPPASRGGSFVVVVLLILVIWFGIYPTPLLTLVRTTRAGSEDQNTLPTSLTRQRPLNASLSRPMLDNTQSREPLSSEAPASLRFHRYEYELIWLHAGSTTSQIGCSQGAVGHGCCR